MGFTTQCFIRKNTDNIRNRLKELGYYCNPYLGWHNLLYPVKHNRKKSPKLAGQWA